MDENYNNSNPGDVREIKPDIPSGFGGNTPKKGGGFKAFLIILLLLVIAGGAVLWFTDPFGWKEDPGSKTEKTSQNTPTDSAKKGSTDTPAPTEKENTPTKKPGNDDPEPTKEPTPTESPAETVPKSVISLSEDDEFDKFLDETMLKLVSSGYTFMHQMITKPEDIGIDIPVVLSGEEEEDFLTDEFMKFVEDNLEKFDRDELSDSQKMCYDLLAYEMDMFHEGEKYDPYVASEFSQNSCYISGVQSVFNEYRIFRDKDAEDYLTLLEQVPKYLQKAEKEARTDVMDDNAMFTRAMYDNALEMGRNWLSDSVEDEVIYIAFKNQLANSEVDEEKQKEYLEKAAGIIEDKIYPAINSYIAFVESLEGCIDDPKGLCEFEDGKEYYEYVIETFLGTGMDMKSLYKYSADRLKEYNDTLMQMIEDNPMLGIQYYSATSKFGDDPDEVMEALKEKTLEDFPDIGELEWNISYLAKEQEVDSTSAYFMNPPLDNINLNTIKVNRSNVSDTLELAQTLAHEGIPGHLYQQQYVMRQEGYQEVRAMLTYLGYTEGWAVYVERLALEWCLDNKTLAELFDLEKRINYLMVAVADIGVNYYGLDKAQLLEWLDGLGYGNEGTADYVYNIVISDPGLYSSYGIGTILMDDTIQALKDKGMSEKEAYKAILDVDSVPYSFLWDELEIESPIEKVE